MLSSLIEGMFISVIDVPDGEEPFSWYAKWKRKKWFKKVSPLQVLMVGVGLGGGLVAILMHFLTKGGG